MTSARKPASFKQNSKLADKLLAQFSSQTVRNDIIPDTAIPLFKSSSDSNLTLLSSKFGKEKAKAFIEYQKKYDEVSEMVQEVVSELKLEGTQTLEFTKQLARSYCGAHRCGESAIRMIFDAFEAGCKEPLHLVVVAGAPGVNNPDPEELDHYASHAFVIIGDFPGADSDSPSLMNLKNVSKNAVLLDGFLRQKGCAQDIAKILGDYFKKFGINRVSNTFSMDPVQLKEKFEMIIRNAKMIADIVKKRMEANKLKMKIFDINKSRKILPLSGEPEVQRNTLFFIPPASRSVAKSPELAGFDAPQFNAAEELYFPKPETQLMEEVDKTLELLNRLGR
jgi:hypothetical protein